MPWRFLFISFFALSACDSNTESRRAEFTSLDACLKGISEDSGQLLEIIIDTPNKVNGFLKDGKGFGCNKVVGGTKGVYYEGWYHVEKVVQH